MKHIFPCRAYYVIKAKGAIKMKRDFLRQLGIEDKETIDKIMDENMADTNRVKVELENKVTELTDAKTKLSDLEKELNDAKAAAAKVEELTKQLTTLTEENTKLKTERDSEVSALKLNSALELALRDNKAKNVKAVKALLDMDKISLEDTKLVGLEEQLSVLKEDANSSFLFGGEEQTPPPAGTEPGKGTGASGKSQLTFAEAVAQSLQK